MSTPSAQRRLLMIAHRFQRNDGQGRVLYEVALAALNRGFSVTLLAAFCAEEIAALPNARFVRIGKEYLPTFLLRNMAFADESSRWLKLHRNEFDLVYANGFITWEQCDIVSVQFVHTAWAKSAHYPYARSLSPYSLYQRAFTTLHGRWERPAFLKAKHIITASEIVANDVQKLGVPSSRVEVIYNGVDTDEFRPGPPERASFNLPSEVPLALFVGDIRSPRKNLAAVLRAMQTIPDLHLAVAGAIDRSPAPELCKKLKISERVHFLGKTPRVPSLMRSVDLFVFPTRYEAHPLVVLEAMASGLPVVVSKNVGSLKSFSSDLFDVLDDPDDVSSLAALMAGLMASPERRKRMGARAREWSLTLRWSDMADRYIGTFQTFFPAESSSTIPEK